MKREIIEDMAEDYVRRLYEENEYPICAEDIEIDVRTAFEDGARWRIASVWHDAREIPKLREHIVVKTKQGDFTSWFVTPDIMQVFDKFNVELWARSSDLLPEGKEDKQ